ncbi:hypothetical protein HMPREF9348_02814 [Escherichia coli MS 145-7]|nr:hypothetical protein HMPREF9348_02814 [Escherichia coli MS 145-7]
MTDGASSSAKRKPSLAPAPPAPRNEVVAPFAPGSCPNDPFRTEKSKTRHQLSVPEKHRKKDYGEKKSQIPFNAHFFCRQLPGYSIPLLCHNNPHCFFVFVCCLSQENSWSGKTLSAMWVWGKCKYVSGYAFFA